MSKTILELEGLTKYYHLRGGPFNRGRGVIKAVDDVSLEVGEGTTFGIADSVTTTRFSSARICPNSRPSRSYKNAVWSGGVASRALKRAKPSGRRFRSIAAAMSAPGQR